MRGGLVSVNGRIFCERSACESMIRGDPQDGWCSMGLPRGGQVEMRRLRGGYKVILEVANMRQVMLSSPCCKNTQKGFGWMFPDLFAESGRMAAAELLPAEKSQAVDVSYGGRRGGWRRRGPPS